MKKRLIFAINRLAFFRHVYKSIGMKTAACKILLKGIPVNDNQAAEAFKSEFSSNFTRLTKTTVTETQLHSGSLLHINCTETDIMAALKSCGSSNSSPDGVSFRLLKEVAKNIIRPLLIVCQQSFCTDTFPAVFKHAVVVPIYKGRGDRASVESYRPVSLCSCLGKVLEKIACLQLTSFLAEKNLLHKAQHGFVAGRSTLTNLLTADCQMSSFIAANHPFDIISFDVKKAFGKMPHDRVIESLGSKEVGGAALLWFSNFFTSRTQQVKIGQVLSAVSNVTSGVIQGSVLGPVLFIVFLDSLLRRLKH